METIVHMQTYGDYSACARIWKLYCLRKHMETIDGKYCA